MIFKEVGTRTHVGIVTRYPKLITSSYPIKLIAYLKNKLSWKIYKKVFLQRLTSDS